MRWRHHHQPRGDSGDGQRQSQDAEVLVVEAAAYLGGRSAELFVSRRATVPSWAWINAPTHLTGREVLDLAEQVPSGQRHGQRWEAVPIAVAAALVVLSYGSTTTISELQLGRLLPLELALMDGDAQAQTAGELVHLAVLALRTGRWHCLT